MCSFTSLKQLIFWSICRMNSKSSPSFSYSVTTINTSLRRLIKYCSGWHSSLSCLLMKSRISSPNFSPYRSLIILNLEISNWIKPISFVEESRRLLTFLRKHFKRASPFRMLCISSVFGRSSGEIVLSVLSLRISASISSRISMLASSALGHFWRIRPSLRITANSSGLEISLPRISRQLTAPPIFSVKRRMNSSVFWLPYTSSSRSCES